ncbi:hypothetical protein K437DRAFT_28292 [Tilletiaria anomala UBC 951]|uniref:Uncharacterized protein n=1 Tax=Tilletiaria anomala (strain ATCC 24038 / CBS 436.72 / UBC 951) TaxID=1037660 RepID=A0A066V956_TILAU|nr:uncharacterized protein K437DRAFT_28292 [Tilletiaria anomala UBC 951]KDN38272.1 hypothetical protein K437DRAFT_28292 [Tilletiaria anomala UBC 951]
MAFAAQIRPSLPVEDWDAEFADASDAGSTDGDAQKLTSLALLPGDDEGARDQGWGARRSGLGSATHGIGSGDADEDDSDQHDTIKLSQLESSTLAQLREVSQVSRAAAAASTGALCGASLATSSTMTPTATSIMPQHAEDSEDWDTDLQPVHGHPSLYLHLPARVAVAVGSGSELNRTFHEEFGFDDEVDNPFAFRSSRHVRRDRDGGESASASGRSVASSSAGEFGGGGGAGSTALSSTEWTEPESPSFSSATPSSSKPSPSTTRSSPASCSRILPSSQAHQSYQYQQHQQKTVSVVASAVLRKASRSFGHFPGDNADRARAKGMLGVDAPFETADNDLEDAFEMDVSLQQLSLSPSLLHYKTRDGALRNSNGGVGFASARDSLPISSAAASGAEGDSFSTRSSSPEPPLRSKRSAGAAGAAFGLKNYASSLRLLSSYPSSDAANWRQSSKASLSDPSSKEEPSRSRRPAVDADADDDDDEEGDDNSHDEREDEEHPWEGLEIPPERPAPAVSSSSVPFTPLKISSEAQQPNKAARSFDANSLKAMLRARKKGLLIPDAFGSSASRRGSASPVSPRTAGASGEEMLNGLVITDDSDLSPHRLRARKDRNADASAIARRQPGKERSADASKQQRAASGSVLIPGKGNGVARPPQARDSAAGTASHPFSRKASMPDLGQATNTASRSAGGSGRGSLNVKGDRLQAPENVASSQMASTAEVAAVAAGVFVAPAGALPKKLFSPVSQIFTRALTSTDAFKTWRPQASVPTAQTLSAVAARVASTSVSADDGFSKAPEPSKAPKAPAQSQITKRRAPIAVRYSVSTASLRQPASISSDRLPIRVDTLLAPTTAVASSSSPSAMPGSPVCGRLVPPVENISEVISAPMEAGRNGNGANTSTAPPLAAAPQMLRHPKRLRNYGDGMELDVFDDLPLQRVAEHGHRFRQPTIEHRPIRASGRLAARGLQQALGVPLVAPPKASSHALSPQAQSQAQAHAVSLHRPHTPGKTKDDGSGTGSATATTAGTSTPAGKARSRTRKRKAKGKESRKPMLIKNLGGAPSTPKSVGEMRWNPKSQRWEGNEMDLKSFDEVLGPSARPALITQFSSSTSGHHSLQLQQGKADLTAPSALNRVWPSQDRIASAPLIASESPSSKDESFASAIAVTATVSKLPRRTTAAAATIVGEMRFDPVQMRWVKASGEEEEDIFADLCDGGGSDHEEERVDNEDIAPWDESTSQEKMVFAASACTDASSADDGSASGDVVDALQSRMLVPEELQLACREAERVHAAEIGPLISVAAAASATATRAEGVDRGAPPDRRHLWLLFTLLQARRGA